MTSEPKTILLFDTDCVLCSFWVHFILRHERDDTILFYSAWSKQGTKIAADHGMTPEDLHKTYLVVENGIAHTKSEATFVLMKHLKMPYRAARILRFFPSFLRNFVYDTVAKNRYKWFGHKDACFLPPANQTHRFIDA